MLAYFFIRHSSPDRADFAAYGGIEDFVVQDIRITQGFVDHEIEQLADIGVKLGADVPVFVHGQAAWAEGVGECIEAIELPEPWFVVLVPASHVSTATVFQDPDLTRDSPRITIRAFAAGDTLNDCLPVVRKRYPEVAQAIDWLAKFADAGLTGTGACVFAGFDTQAAAERTLAQLSTGTQGFVARGMNRSPLLGRLAEESREQ